MAERNTAAQRALTGPEDGSRAPEVLVRGGLRVEIGDGRIGPVTFDGTEVVRRIPGEERPKGEAPAHTWRGEADGNVRVGIRDTDGTAPLRAAMTLTARTGTCVNRGAGFVSLHPLHAAPRAPGPVTLGLLCDGDTA